MKLITLAEIDKTLDAIQKKNQEIADYLTSIGVGYCDPLKEKYPKFHAELLKNRTLFDRLLNAREYYTA